MNKYSTIAEIKEYRDYEAISQSFLKSVLSNNTRPFKGSVQATIGSYIDCLLTCPTDANNLFQEGLDKRPSDAIKGFIDIVYTTMLEGNTFGDFEDYKEMLLEIAKSVNYQPRWGEDAIWNSIKKDGEDYWNELKEAQGKEIITKEEVTLSKTLADLTLSSSITGKYFIEQDKVDKYFQKPLFWTSEEEPCKGLLDLLIIEHQTKTIYIIDIKNTGVVSLKEWMMIARQKKYPFQLSFYKKGVEFNYADLIEQGYKIKCRWIVIPSNIERFKPWVIPCTDELLAFGKYGYRIVRQVGRNEPNNNSYLDVEKEYQGWLDALNIYKESKSKGLLDYDLLWDNCEGKLPEENVANMFF